MTACPLRTVSAALLALCCLPALAQTGHGDVTWREVQVAGRKIILDNRPVKLSLEVVDEFKDDPADAALARGTYRSYRDAWSDASSRGARILPSVSLIAAKGKKLDDGLYAAVELAAEKGEVSPYLAKRQFLEGLLTALSQAKMRTPFGERVARLAVSRVVGALMAGGATPKPLPARFDREEAGSFSRKPVGFYTWSPALESIYRRDTALQHRFRLEQPEEVGAMALIVRTILGDRQLKGQYTALNWLYSKLTNPLTSLSAEEVLQGAGGAGDLQNATEDSGVAKVIGERLEGFKSQVPGVNAAGFAIFQPSEARENAAVYEGGMDAFIAGVRSGKISLKPTENSGWYDYQQYALEPLLTPDKTPEARKMELGEKYRKLLESAFQSMAAQVRETHVKQLEMMKGAAPVSPVTITPDLAVEPLPTVYERMREAYTFVMSVTSDRGLSRRVHALDEGAKPRPETLDHELWDHESLVRGLGFLACRDLGLEPSARASNLQTGPRPLMDKAEAWLSKWWEDPDLARDVRMMIQVAAQPNRFWAVTGVRLTKLHVKFITPPKVIGEGVTATFGDADYWVPTERFVEVTDLKEPLNREEFRALCDRAKTEDAILRELRALGGKAGGGAVGTLVNRLADRSPDGGGEPLPRWARLGALILGLAILLVLGVVVWTLVRAAVGRR